MSGHHQSNQDYQERRGGRGQPQTKRGQQVNLRGGYGYQNSQSNQSSGQYNPNSYHNQGSQNYQKKNTYKEQQYQREDEEEPQLTAEQKFNQMFGSLEQTETVQVSNPNRIRYEKQVLLEAFVKVESDEAFQLLEKEDQLSFIDILEMTSHQPEAFEPTEQSAGHPQKKQAPGIKQYGNNEWSKNINKPGYGDNRYDDEDEEDPEWVDFDPEKEKSNFFGRAIPNEEVIRDKFKQEKERTLQQWNSTKKNQTDDMFEQLIKREKEVIQKKVMLNKQLIKEAENLATDLEQNENNYSDIDKHFEKNVKQKSENQKVLDDDEIDDLFSSLMEAQDLKKQSQTNAEEQKQSQSTTNQKLEKELPKEFTQIVQDQIQTITIQQKLQLESQKLVTQEKPKFTALQNIQNLFSRLPVVNHEKHRIKLEEIGQVDQENELKENLFKQLMSSINPFSKYVIEECQQGVNHEDKQWLLEESIFQKPPGTVNPENLKKTSSEMFVICKYFSDPFMKVKSEEHTEGQYKQMMQLFPQQSLLQTPAFNMLNPLNFPFPQQAQGQPPMNFPPNMMFNMMQQQQLQNTSNQSPIQIPQTQINPNQDVQLPQSSDSKASIIIPEENIRQQKEPTKEPTKENISNNLSDMELQLKSLLGFNPK